MNEASVQQAAQRLEDYAALASSTRLREDVGTVLDALRGVEATEFLPYLQGVAALVWRWRAEAEYMEGMTSPEVVSCLRECANELANSIPARIVAYAGREHNSRENVR